jgi:rare lipoprotein A
VAARSRCRPRWRRGASSTRPNGCRPGRWPTWRSAATSRRAGAAGATATPITLEGSTGKQYWLGFQNYYAITRYNLSKMYAMAVFQLSQAIAGQELPRHEHQMAGPWLDRPRAGCLQQRAEEAGHGRPAVASRRWCRAVGAGALPGGSPYAAAKEDLSTRGNYTAGGLYKPGVRDSTPDYIPNVACIPEPEVTAEERSAIGNKSPYVVLGKSYKVLDDTHDYVERGTASYYGAKFHGRLTSNREVYDMYQFTAAHKTLPLPSFARVTNLDNGESVIVRVNDRGPFHDGRVVDLSYAAAVRRASPSAAPAGWKCARCSRARATCWREAVASRASCREAAPRRGGAGTGRTCRRRQRHRSPGQGPAGRWHAGARPAGHHPRAWPAPCRTWRSAACRRVRRRSRHRAGAGGRRQRHAARCCAGAGPVSAAPSLSQQVVGAVMVRVASFPAATTPTARWASSAPPASSARPAATSPPVAAPCSACAFPPATMPVPRNLPAASPVWAWVRRRSSRPIARAGAAGHAPGLTMAVTFHPPFPAVSLACCPMNFRSAATALAATRWWAGFRPDAAADPGHAGACRRRCRPGHRRHPAGPGAQRVQSLGA